MWCFPFPRTTRESIGWRRNTHARPARSSSSVGGVPDSTVALTCAVNSNNNVLLTLLVSNNFVELKGNVFKKCEVPNLFPQDEKPAVMEQARLLAKKLKDPAANGESPQELWDFFVKMTKEKLHVVLCMSPVGDAFRERLRQFPSLVNCCTIDWFQVWPADALEAVARTKLNAIDELLKAVAANDEVAKQQRVELIKICKMFHADTRDTALEFKAKTGRIS